jgi:hypothetical protein
MYRSNRISSDGHGKKLVATKEMLVEESADYIKERDGALGVTKTFSGDLEVDPHVIEANNQFANTQVRLPRIPFLKKIFFYYVVHTFFVCYIRLLEFCP